MTALPPLPALIGLSGYAGSGKSTLADLLADRHGYLVRGFADPLRKLCRLADPMVASVVGHGGGFVPLHWSVAVDAMGYEGAKRDPSVGPQVRGFIQRLGQGARQVLGENVWVDAAMIGLDQDWPTVFADCRYPNEAEAILRHYGPDMAAMIRIERPGVGPVNGHVSETALDGWPFDAVLVNDGPPEQMLEQLAAVYALPEVAR